MAAQRASGRRRDVAARGQARGRARIPQLAQQPADAEEHAALVGAGHGDLSAEPAAETQAGSLRLPGSQARRSSDAGRAAGQAPMRATR